MPNSSSFRMVRRAAALTSQLRLGLRMASTLKATTEIPRGRPGIILPVPHVALQWRQPPASLPQSPTFSSDSEESTPGSATGPEFKFSKGPSDGISIGDVVLFLAIGALMTFMGEGGTPISKNNQVASLEKLVASVEIAKIKEDGVALTAHFKNIVRTVDPTLDEKRLVQALESTETFEIAEVCGKIHQIVSEDGLDRQKKVFVVSTLLSNFLASKRGQSNEPPEDWVPEGRETSA
ncbi:Methyltransf-25 domain-containing protein [Mycena indigotica]|uniref:Methyltransf-25 domain-containing protein n=1 Tax=Mycena indigotica TaxID=2126181 RepID=A0A8H6T4N3_9AGAR|nr:Methyltransf-25 domain-containing protein [Mycena indigotica]KAF7309837.1 Methyltransf-25 domain-containing protein [Mycena indigotica]